MERPRSGRRDRGEVVSRATQVSRGALGRAQASPQTIDDGQLLGAYLIYGAPESTWDRPDLPGELFKPAEHDIRDLLARHDKHCRWLLTGAKTPRPVDLRSRFETTLLVDLPVHDPHAEGHWRVRCASIKARSAATLFFDEGLIAADQPAFEPPAPASRFIGTADDIQIDPQLSLRTPDYAAYSTTTTDDSTAIRRLSDRAARDGGGVALTRSRLHRERRLPARLTDCQRPRAIVGIAVCVEDRNRAERSFDATMPGRSRLAGVAAHIAALHPNGPLVVSLESRGSRVSASQAPDQGAPGAR